MSGHATSEGTQPANLALCVLLIAPFVLFTYPALALLASKSTVAVYFHRYSGSLALFNLLNVGIYCAFVWGAYSGRLVLQIVATFGVVAVSLAVLSSNALLGLPAIALVAQATRLAAGLSLIAISQLLDREGRRFLAGASLLIGVLIGLTAFLDLSWSAISGMLSSEKDRQIQGQYRATYDLDGVGGRDVVLIGDSFVWGMGVPIEHRFGNVLEKSRQTADQSARVYSLGVVGESLQGYLRQLQDIPAGRQAANVVVAFYANDMPPRSNLQDALQQAAISLGRGSVTLRAVADIVRVAVTPNAEDYAKLLLTHFDERDGTYPQRWKQLESELEALFVLAQQRSRARPDFLLLPMLTDFENSKFDEPLHHVGRLAARVGFRVVDTMPAFRADGQRAQNYRAAPNDLHLNERGNRIVADVLERLVGNRLAAGEQLDQDPRR
jgi:hypothetical protein